MKLNIRKELKERERKVLKEILASADIVLGENILFNELLLAKQLLEVEESNLTRGAQQPLETLKLYANMNVKQVRENRE